MSPVTIWENSFQEKVAGKWGNGWFPLTLIFTTSRWLWAKSMVSPLHTHYDYILILRGHFLESLRLPLHLWPKRISADFVGFVAPGIVFIEPLRNALGYLIELPQVLLIESLRPSPFSKSFSLLQLSNSRGTPPSVMQHYSYRWRQVTATNGGKSTARKTVPATASTSPVVNTPNFGIATTTTLVPQNGQPNSNQDSYV